MSQELERDLELARIFVTEYAGGDMELRAAMKRLSERARQRERLVVLLSRDVLEQYISDLPWSDSATGENKTLVAANLRALASHVLSRADLELP